jgi:hypothetical protein
LCLRNTSRRPTGRKLEGLKRNWRNPFKVTGKATHTIMLAITNSPPPALSLIVAARRALAVSASGSARLMRRAPLCVGPVEGYLKAVRSCTQCRAVNPNADQRRRGNSLFVTPSTTTSLLYRAGDCKFVQSRPPESSRGKECLLPNKHYPQASGLLRASVSVGRWAQLAGN